MPIGQEGLYGASQDPSVSGDQRQSQAAVRTVRASGVFAPKRLEQMRKIFRDKGIAVVGHAKGRARFVAAGLACDSAAARRVLDGLGPGGRGQPDGVRALGRTWRSCERHATAWTRTTP